MKPYMLILLLTLTLASTLHAASEYTITNKNRVIQEATLDQNRIPIGTKLPAVSFTTLDGKTHNLDILTKHRPVVLTFLATECPVAQRYTMRLKRLHAEFTGHTFVAVYANENDSVEDVKAYVAKSEYPFHIVKDAAGRLARAFGATMTPQAFVVGPARTLQYRGAIDDNRYETRVKHHYLRDALIATRDSTSVAVQETPAFGLHNPSPRNRVSPKRLPIANTSHRSSRSNARPATVKAKSHPSHSSTTAMPRHGQPKSPNTHKHGSCHLGNPRRATATSKTNAALPIPKSR